MADTKEPKQQWTPEKRAEALKAIREGKAALSDYPELRKECAKRGGLPTQ